MFQRRKLRRPAAEDQVVLEAMAVVEGRTLTDEPWGGRGRRWVLRLAHIGWEDLQHVASWRSYLPNSWDAAASYVARDLLETAKDAEGLIAIQRSLLIPLELELLAGRVASPSTPSDLVKVVDRHQRFRR